MRLLFDGLQWSLTWSEARVTFTPFRYVPRLDEDGIDDPLVVAGTVTSSAAGWHGPIANIVCERSNQTVSWSLVQFRSSAMVGNNYHYGPVGLSHGFGDALFKSERIYMLRSAAHVWVRQAHQLSVDRVIELFNDAIAGL